MGERPGSSAAVGHSHRCMTCSRFGLGWVLGLLTACGVSERGEVFGGSSDYRGERSEPTSAIAEPEGPVLVVPPDGARVDVSLSVDGKAFADTGARVREVVASLVSAVEEGEGCAVAWDDYAPAVARGEASFSGRAQLRLQVDFRGLADTAARTIRLDDCSSRVRGLVGDEDVRMQLSTPIVTLARPEAHLDALLEQRLAPLRALEERADAPLHFEPARCRSSGAVRVIDRRMSGVTLGLDFRCDGVAAGA